MSLTTTDSKKEAFTADELKENCLRLSRSIANLRQELDERLRDSYTLRLDRLENRLGTIQGELLKPSRLGFVGQVSAGKTQLLETLLGNAGGILSKNVGSGATTGNIVEYCVSEGEGNETTFENWRARVVSEDRVDELFALYVKEFEKIAGYSSSLQNQADELRELQNRKNQISYQEFWRQCAEWAKKVYEGRTESSIRMLTLEIFRIARVVSSSQSWLGNEFEISEEQALDLMTLPNDRLKPDSLTNDELNAPIWTEDLTLNDLEPEVFDAFFHIIHKLTVDVRVPRNVFDFYSQYGGSFRFVDCPGYGASGSSIRDKALCFVELQDVDAVLVLLDSKNPGHKSDFFEQAAERWGDVVAREKMIVVLNKFDLLQIRAEKATEDAFNGLKSDEKTTVSDDDVLGVLSNALKQPYTYALENVQNRNPRRVVFFSSFAHIGWRRTIDSVSLGTAEEMEKYIDSENWSGKRECDDWKIVASKMDAKSELRALLYDFANDGGGRRLVDAFGDLLNRSGRKNQLIRMRREFEALDADWTLTLANFQEDSKALDDAQDSNDVLNGDDKKKTLGELQELLKGIAGNQTTKLDELIVEKIDGAGKRFRVLAINNVAKWDVWRSLLNACDRSFLVNFGSDARNPPRKTTDFAKYYLKTITAMYRNVLKSLERILNEAFEDYETVCFDWKDDQITRVSAIFKEYESSLDDFELFTERRRQWFKEPLVGSMTNLLDLNLLRDRLNKKMGISDADVDEKNFTRSGYGLYYPLQREPNPLTLAWDAEAIETARKHGVSTVKQRHLAGVLQIRQAFFDAFALFAEDVYSEAKYLILQHLREVCGDEVNDGLLVSIARIKGRINDEAKSTTSDDEDEEWE